LGKNKPMNISDFAGRHIGANLELTKTLVKATGHSSLDELIDKTVPKAIRLEKPMSVCDPLSEFEYNKHIRSIAAQNELYTSFIGQGYYNTITPAVIQRNILENPGWYTAYTPYQAEISQGRLEALLNYQTMISDLTALPIANASLLDEATSAAEAMSMLFHTRSKTKSDAKAIKFFVAEHVFAQTIDVLKTRSTPLGIELVIGNHETTTLDASYFGAMIQYPTAQGSVLDFSGYVAKLQALEIKLIVAADLLSLTLLTPPGEWGADVVVGSSQRFGVPMGFGGPHAAFFATKEEFKRNIPGRIIGVSVDRRGGKALRMALQTREQHIRRDKATSNICTAQALLAIMASMYAVYHGAEGVKNIAQTIHDKTKKFADLLIKNGVPVLSQPFFDTISIVSVSPEHWKSISDKANQAQLNVFYSNATVSISFDETTQEEDMTRLLEVLRPLFSTTSINALVSQWPVSLVRKTSYLTHPIFQSYHTETEMMRYIKKLENKDISLTRSMISLGSCTMKLNAASELYPISLPSFAQMHPFAPSSQTKGYQNVIENLSRWLSEITGFAGVSLQPNSGAQGEYTGLMVIRAFQKHQGQAHRNIALIPSSAHGTNPATAVIAGLQVVVVLCDDKGNIDVNDLKVKAEKYKDSLSCLMVTYPSTHGVFEEKIKEITDIIHANGGQVYMDGANMNAQVGLTSPGFIGADVCHLNLHKTFAIPHGGGGPGVGPIGVAKHLVPFLPSHSVVKTSGDLGIHAVSAAPWGSALILLISYAYIKMLGTDGLTHATKIAILNANYMKSRLEGNFPILYKGSNGNVAHEMILDCREFKRTSGVEVEDIAKRLMDYGYHAPTVSFPVAGTLMIEPTESESKAELDRFCDALISIRHEIQEIEEGKYTAQDNVLKNAPHTALEITSDDWAHAYSRKKASFPLSWVEENKYWTPVSRVDNAYGDRNLVCTCPSIEEYQEELAV
jgi:glycine dehydrogenase